MTTILIVDDFKDNRTTISLLLEAFEDIKTIEASNGLEAVEICKKDNSIDLVLMDVMMPVMDGIEATRIISSLPDRPMIVAVSAINDNGKKNDMLKAGAQDYMKKPIDDDLFVARVKNYIRILFARQQRNFKNEWAINPFSSKIYAKKTLFRITKESALCELWETFLLNGAYAVNEAMSDCIGAIFTAGIALLKKNGIFDIVIEENDDNIFFNFTNIESYDKDAVKKFFQENYPQGKTVFGAVAFSVLLTKETLDAKQYAVHQEESDNAKTKSFEDANTYNILRNTSQAIYQKLSAEEFLKDFDISYYDKLDNLIDKEDALDADLFEFETANEILFLKKIGATLHEYTDIIESLHEFKNISYALYKLSEIITKTRHDKINSKKITKLTILLKSLFSDMTEWRNQIFYDKSAKDIHYLDASLMSSCIQIESVLNDDNSVHTEEELELF